MKIPMTAGRVLMALGSVMILLLIWMGRYQMVPVGKGIAYRMDRWTGAVRFCDPDNCVIVPDSPPPQAQLRPAE